MPRNIRSIASSVLLFSTALTGGYYLGKQSSIKHTEQLERQSNDPHHAMRVILSRQNTWRTQYHSAYPNASLNTSAASEQSINGREGAWVSIFKPRFTGAATCVVFKNTEDGKVYLLQTVQKRIINGKEMVVCEPPSGFYNGAYLSSTTHAVAEDAEREIEKHFRLNQPYSHTLAYERAKQKWRSGALMKTPYIEDRDLWQTAYREIQEETGLDVSALGSNPDFTMTKKLHDEIDIDVPGAYVSMRVINISGKKIPTLAKLEGDEVISAEWVPLENFNLEKQQVKTASKGILPIKPEVLPFTSSIVKEESSRSAKIRLK